MVIAQHPCIARSKEHLFQPVRGGNGWCCGQFLVQLMAGTIFLMYRRLFPGTFLCILCNGL